MPDPRQQDASSGYHNFFSALIRRLDFNISYFLTRFQFNTREAEWVLLSHSQSDGALCQGNLLLSLREVKCFSATWRWRWRGPPLFWLSNALGTDFLWADEGILVESLTRHRRRVWRGFSPRWDFSISARFIRRFHFYQKQMFVKQEQRPPTSQTLYQLKTLNLTRRKNYNTEFSRPNFLFQCFVIFRFLQSGFK